MQPLERLRKQYIILSEYLKNNEDKDNKRTDWYKAMRLFCLDCNLVSFIDIEIMEYEESKKL